MAVYSVVEPTPVLDEEPHAKPASPGDVHISSLKNTPLYEIESRTIHGNTTSGRVSRCHIFFPLPSTTYHPHLINAAHLLIAPITRWE
jgi:hypothetical protein